MDIGSVGPALFAATEAFARRDQESVLRQARVLGLVTASDESPKPARAVVFLDVGDASTDGLAERHGIELNHGEGPVRTAIVPIESIDGLSEDPTVRRITGSRPMRALLDVARTSVRVPQFVTRTHLTGKGVIIGVVDTGIDPNHPAFAGRILSIWDQQMHGPGVLEGHYGKELAGADLTLSRDDDGHGTHVSGIAAGRDPEFGGLAPDAELVVVRSDLSDAHITDGIRYIARVARQHGRPCVINLSVGGHWDAHDGTDSLSTAVDGISGAGCIVCTAAGNEGNDAIHARTTVSAGRTTTIHASVHAPRGASEPEVVYFNGWYSGDDELEVGVASPGGHQTPFQPLFRTGNPARNYTLPDGTITVVTGRRDAGNHDHQFLVYVNPRAGRRTVKGGTWRLRLRGVNVVNGRVDVWLIDDSEEGAARFTGPAVEDDTKVGSPGAATNALTVACYTTKNSWTDVDGDGWIVAHDVRDITDISSEGPRRDGVEKPDLAAPGAMIASALSADSTAERADMLDDTHVVMSGSSMASPFVTGLVALMLEKDATLTPDGAREALRKASRVPHRRAGSFDRKWGYGLINADGLLKSQ